MSDNLFLFLLGLLFFIKGTSGIIEIIRQRPIDLYPTSYSGTYPDNYSAHFDPPAPVESGRNYIVHLQQP